MYYHDGIYKRTGISGIIKYIWNLLLQLLAGFLCVLLVLIFLFGYKPFIVVSGSMLPTLNVGDIIFVKATDDKMYEVGDIITYPEGGSYTTHRIVEVNGDMVITKGDANNTTDAPKRMSIIVGKTIFRLYKIGIIYDFIKTHLLLSASFLLIFWASLTGIRNEIDYYKRPAGSTE